MLAAVWATGWAREWGLMGMPAYQQSSLSQVKPYDGTKKKQNKTMKARNCFSVAGLPCLHHCYGFVGVGHRPGFYLLQSLDVLGYAIFEKV